MEGGSRVWAAASERSVWRQAKPLSSPIGLFPTVRATQTILDSPSERIEVAHARQDVVYLRVDEEWRVPLTVQMDVSNEARERWFGEKSLQK
jgi:hypothetical protein